MRSFIDFACFVSMFPQLVAGPIIRFSEVADQLAVADAHARRSSRAASRSSPSAWPRRCCSPTPAARSPTCRSTPARSAPLDAWYGVTAYAFQIYFDFSGYSDMAIGLGLMLGFVFAEELRLALPVAVDHRVLAPLAHLALDLAARLPLHAARRQPQGPGAHLRQPARRHAARRPLARRGVDFVVWGGLHGVLLAFERLARQGGALRAAARRRCGSPCTFVIVLVTWVFFRAADLPHAFRYLGDMSASATPHAGAACSPASSTSRTTSGRSCWPASIVWAAPQTWDWTRELTMPKAATALALLVLAVDRAHDAGVQPVHLLHLLMTTWLRTNRCRPADPSREEIAQREIGVTTISPATTCPARSSCFSAYLHDPGDRARRRPRAVTPPASRPGRI